MTKYYLLAFLLLFIPLCALLVHLNNKGYSRAWLQKIPMPILVIVLVWLCNELIFLDRTLGWLWVKEKYCTDSGVIIKRKIPKNAFLVIEPASVDSDPKYQTLEMWIGGLPLADDYIGEFAIDVVNPMVRIRPNFPGDISHTTTLIWRGKSAAGVCLHMRKNGRVVEVLSECGSLFSDLKRPIVRMKKEIEIGLDGMGMFNILRSAMVVFDSSGPFVEIRNYRYGGGWLAKTIPPGEDSFAGRVTYPVGSYSCLSANVVAEQFSILYWLDGLSK